MGLYFRPILAVLIAGCGSIFCAEAEAQSGAPGISFSRADGIVEHPLVTSAVNLGIARPRAIPSIALPVDPGAVLQVAQNAPAKPKINMRDTGNPSVAPLKWVGMVLTQLDQNHAEYCTGQFIAPRVVLTAGHCVKDIDKNTWNDVNAMTFTLQYQNGEGSHVYKVVCTAALDAYTHPANYSSMTDDQQTAADLAAHQYDFAMMLVDADSLTGKIVWQGDWKGNWVGATRIGYPNDILNGEVIQEAHGIVFFADAVPIFTSNGNQQSYPNLVVHWQRNTKILGGSSGGAWIANFDATENAQNNIAIGITSFDMPAFPGAMFGPYLSTQSMNALLQFTQQGCHS
jgi:V8-like Glu-specific endopeptidase